MPFNFPRATLLAMALVLLSAGCASETPNTSEIESSTVGEATTSGRIDVEASAACNALLGGNGPIIASYYATTSEVRDYRDIEGVDEGFDEGLPVGAENRVAVCIYDVRQVANLGNRAAYQARWAATAAQVTTIGVIAQWGAPE